MTLHHEPDPFLQILEPPSETSEQREKRLLQEEDARRRSSQIDDELHERRKALDRRKKGVRFLLLGQSESGKTALYKNFQMKFAPKQFEKERRIWKYVIHLNIIRSVKSILDALEEEWSSPPSSPPVSPNKVSPSPTDLRRIVLSLKPLDLIERKLSFLLRCSTFEGEVSVHAGDRWKRLLGARRSSIDSTVTIDSNEDDPWTTAEMDREDSSHVLLHSKEDIITLWRSPVVADVLFNQGVNLKNQSGFFLDDVHRIVVSNYIPTDEDIVRARLKTLGTEERRYTLETGPYVGDDMYITDVGGSRYHRPKWADYFDDMHAILFLAPLSFDEFLEEPGFPRVNKIKDSLELWKTICAYPTLQNTTLVLFFNKKDLLQRRVADGVMLKKFVPSYGERPNTVEEITIYFRDRFKTHHKKVSPKKRAFIFYESSAINTHATGVLLVSAYDAILRANLERSEVL